MHLLPSKDYVLLNEEFDIVRTPTGYRVSVQVVAKRTGGRNRPCLIAWSPIAGVEDAMVEATEILCAVGDLITDDEFEWYRANNGQWFYTMTRAETDVDDECTLQMTWSVKSPRLHVPLRQPLPSAPLPVTTIRVAGGHNLLITKPFERKAVGGNTKESSTTFTRSKRPVHDLVEAETNITKPIQDGNCAVM